MPRHAAGPPPSVPLPPPPSTAGRNEPPRPRPGPFPIGREAGSQPSSRSWEGASPGREGCGGQSRRHNRPTSRWPPVNGSQIIEVLRCDAKPRSSPAGMEGDQLQDEGSEKGNGTGPRLQKRFVLPFLLSTHFLRPRADRGSQAKESSERPEGMYSKFTNPW
jgi:hypothetical protein